MNEVLVLLVSKQRRARSHLGQIEIACLTCVLNYAKACKFAPASFACLMSV